MNSFFIILFLVFFGSYAEPSDIYDYITIAAEQLLSNDSKILKCFFIPQPKQHKYNIKHILLGLVQAETERIDAALFRLNDTDLAHALCQAHMRGVKIYLVLDWTAYADRSNKIDMVTQIGIPVYKYSSSATMHNKFFVFYKNLWEKQIVWTGSANVTRSGLTLNEENVIVTDHKSCFDEYQNRFDYLVETVKQQQKEKLTTRENSQLSKPYMAALTPSVSYKTVQNFLINSWKSILRLATRIH